MLNKIDELAMELDTDSIDELIEKLDSMDDAVTTTALHQDLNDTISKHLRTKLRGLLQDALGHVGGLY